MRGTPNALSYYWWYVPLLQVFLGGTTSQFAPFHPSCSNYRRCNSWLQAFGETSLSFKYCLRFVCDLLSQWQNVNVPPFALCHSMTPKDDRVTTLYILWTAPLVTVTRNSSVHARNRLCMLTVPNSEVENFKTSIGCTR